MRSKTFFLLLFLLPGLVYAFSDKDCKKLREQITLDWNRSSELIAQCSTLQADQKRVAVTLVDEAIACCTRAITNLDKIIKEYRHDKNEWHVLIKNNSKKEKESFLARKEQLSNYLSTLHWGIQLGDLENQKLQESRNWIEVASQKNELATQQTSSIDRINLLQETIQAIDKAIFACEEILGLTFVIGNDAFRASLENYRILIQNYMAPLKESKKSLENQIAYELAQAQ